MPHPNPLQPGDPVPFATSPMARSRAWVWVAVLWAGMGAWSFLVDARPLGDAIWGGDATNLTGRLLVSGLLVAAILRAGRHGHLQGKRSRLGAGGSDPAGGVHRLADETLRLAETVPHIVWSADADGGLHYCNRRGMARLGVARLEDLIGFSWQDRIHPDDLPRVMNLWQQAIRKRRTFRNEQRLWIALEGGWRWHLVEANPVFGPDGEVERFYGISTDIHPLRTAEEERSHLQRQLHAAQKLEVIGKLTGGIAHDFNNNLTAILGGLDLVRQEFAARLGEDSAGMQALQAVEQGAQHAAALTRQLLSFGRKQIRLPRPTDPGDAIRGMDFLLRRLVRDDVTLQVKVPESLPRVLIDPTELEQLVLNLAINAADAMPDGGTLRIEARTEPGGSGQDAVILQVRDSGVGMDAATQERIFEPFFTTKASDRGTGLGLPTVEDIVQRADGTITVASEPGRGSTFTIRFPALGPGAEPEWTPVPEGARHSGSAGATVMVCDDDPNVLRTTSRLLAGAGYEVLATSSGQDARDRGCAPDQRVDLLLLDIMLPGPSGIEIARSMATARGGPPVVFMSGFPPAALPEDVVLDEGRNFLRKPFTSRQLLELVARRLERPMVETAAPTDTPAGGAAADSS